VADLNAFYATFNQGGNEKRANQTASKKKKTTLDSFYATFEQPAKTSPASSDYFKDPANQLAMFEEEPVKKKTTAKPASGKHAAGELTPGQRAYEEKWMKEHPFITKAAKVIGTPFAAVFGNPFMERVGEAGSEVRFMTDNPNKTTTGNKKLDTAADFLGGMTGFVGNPGGAAPSVGGAVFRAGEKGVEQLAAKAPQILPGITKVAQKIPAPASKILEHSGKIAGGSALYEGVTASASDHPVSAGELAKVAGQNVLLGLFLRGLAKTGTELNKTGIPTIENLDLRGMTPEKALNVEGAKPGQVIPSRSSRSGGTVSTTPKLSSVEKDTLRNRLSNELGIKPEPVAPNAVLLPQTPQNPLYRSGAQNIEFPNRMYDPVLANARPIPGGGFIPAPQRTPLIPQEMPQGGQLPPGISPMSFTTPKKMSPVGEGQKARSFQVSAAKAPITDDMTRAGLVSDIYPGGPGAYNPVKLKEVDVEARKMVNINPEKAYRFVMEDKEPGALHTAAGIRLVEKYQNLNNYDRAIDVAEALAEKLTKQGQAISAARLMGALKPDGVLVFAQRQIRKINNSKAFNTKDLKLTPDMAKGLKELSQRVQDAADEGVRLEASQELQQALNSLKPAGIGRKIATGQTIAQLLNTKTIIRNVAGNELFYRLERLNKYPATLIDWTRSRITGGPRTVTFRTAGQGGYWKGFLKGAKAGWKGVNPQGITTQYDLGYGPAFNVKGNIAEKTMAYLERTMGATLKGFDHAAFNRAKNQTLGELATLRAINTTGRANPATVRQFMTEAEDNILNVADEYGKYVTFQDNNMISRGLVAVKRGLNKLTGSEDFGLGDIVLKYPKTPGALIARGLEYSPAGFLKSAYQLAKVKGILRGKADPREVTLALSRAITGTLGLTGLGYYLADVGIITGSADKDKDVRALQQQVGEGPYRVNVSALTRWVRSGFNRQVAEPREGDRLITYDWAQPVAMAISAGANINQSIKEKATAEDAAKGMAGTLAGSLEGAVNTIAEQPVLQGLTRPLQGYSLGESLTGVAKSIPASFAPTLGNQVRTYADNTSRLTYDPNPAREALNKAQVKLPFVAGKLPPAYNTFGQKKETYQDGSNNLFNVFLNPSFVSRYNLTPEARMVVDTFKETGETKQVPRVVPKKFIVSGKSFVLTPQEYSEFQRIVGENTTEGFSRIPDWLPTDRKIDRMVDVLTDAGRKGKRELLEARGIRVREKGNSLILMP